MVDSISNKIVARSAAAMFLLGGFVGLATSPLLDRGSPLLGIELINLASVGLGIFAWWAPWGRWPRRAPLWLTPGAFAIIASSPALGAGSRFPYGMYFLMTFVWFGIGFPRRTSLMMAVPAAVAFTALVAERAPAVTR